jgi:hypothetical protein
LLSIVAAFITLAISATHGYMLLYGDAVAHLGTARGIVDTDHPGLSTLGGVWLPLPHLLMTPFVWKMEWWQNGMAGAWPSMLCYLLANLGIYRLARRILPAGWAFVATAFFGLNANLLYLSGTAMTEPLFLALTVWILLVLLELLATLTELSVFAESRAMGGGGGSAARTALNRVVQAALRQQTLLGVLILAATLTRYDGWILGAAVWCVAAWHVWRNRTARRLALPGFLALTLLAIAGPAFWLWWNQHFAGDWLDFMRGPNSAQAIDRRTSPPGSHHHYGWHDPLYSLVLFMRCAQVDAAAWETGWLVAAASLYAAWRVAAGRAFTFGKTTLKLPKALLLLWLPVPFYVYSIAWGSVPIFIPQLYPNSFYNSRYGLELLPAFAIFGTLAIPALLSALPKLFSRLRSPSGDAAEEPATALTSSSTTGQAAQLLTRIAQPVALLLIALNLVWMTYLTPLVLEEGIVNSRGRLALEVPMAEQLATIPPGQPILIENSTWVGALELAGIPLRQTIGPGDYPHWQAALKNPAANAAYVYAVEGDDVTQAARLHPEGLTQLSIICTTKQPCLRIYKSDRYAAK